MKTWLKITLTGLLLASGCAKKDSEESYMNPFVPDVELRRVHMALDAQAAVGAREDGILYAWHFDGQDLSPLGREKLDQIVEADTLDVLSIYVDVRPATFAARKQSVLAYLQDKGLATSHVNIIEGINEETLTPAVAGLANLPKTETSADEAASSTTDGASANTATSK